MHTPGFTVSGTALMAGSSVTWHRFACNAAWLNEGELTILLSCSSPAFKVETACKRLAGLVTSLIPRPAD
jgi:hypothetical protein